MIEHAKVDLRSAAFKTHQIANRIAGWHGSERFFQETRCAREGLNIYEHGMIADGTLKHLAAVEDLPKQEGCGDGQAVCFFFRDLILLLTQQNISLHFACHTRLKTSVGREET